MKSLTHSLTHSLYVAAVLDPRIKMSLIEAQMNKEGAELIASEVHEFFKHEYPFQPSLPLETERPSGMPEFLWKTLKRVSRIHVRSSRTSTDTWILLRSAGRIPRLRTMILTGY
jgi:hypothetical protein